MPGSLDQTESVYDMILRRHGLVKKEQPRGFYAESVKVRNTEDGWQAKHAKEKARDATSQTAEPEDTQE